MSHDAHGVDPTGCYAGANTIACRPLLGRLRRRLQPARSRRALVLLLGQGSPAPARAYTLVR